MRIKPAAPSSQQRVVLVGGETIAGHRVPEGVSLMLCLVTRKSMLG